MKLFRLQAPANNAGRSAMGKQTHRTLIESKKSNGSQFPLLFLSISFTWNYLLILAAGVRFLLQAGLRTFLAGTYMAFYIFLLYWPPTS
ncbi:hypothetical protein BIV59_08590 [Bacillus sp. MUM 13]|nr:hypothetical protein BIV59_08590 [Bacillus sp. MUM 13]